MTGLEAIVRQVCEQLGELCGGVRAAVAGAAAPTDGERANALLDGEELLSLLLDQHFPEQASKQANFFAKRSIDLTTAGRHAGQPSAMRRKTDHRVVWADGPWPRGRAWGGGPGAAGGGGGRALLWAGPGWAEGPGARSVHRPVIRALSKPRRARVPSGGWPMMSFGIVGTTQGAFKVERVVAEGGFGVVYRAYHEAFRAPVALKCLKVPATLPEQLRVQFLDKFREEAELLFRLSAAIPAVVRPLHHDVISAATGAFVPFIALERLEGRTLASHIASRAATERRSSRRRR